MRREILRFIGIPLVFTFVCSCNSSSYKEEGVERVDTNTISQRTEAKYDTDTSKLEIKEEPVEIHPKITKKFTIQIGAYQYETHAVETLNRAQGLITYKLEYKLQNGLFKVQFGEFDSLPEALQVLESVRSSGFVDSFIVEINKSN